MVGRDESSGTPFVARGPRNHPHPKSGGAADRHRAHADVSGPLTLSGDVAADQRGEMALPERRPPPLARTSRNSVTSSGTPLSSWLPRSSATNKPAIWRAPAP